jgi:hypothetical protein
VGTTKEPLVKKLICTLSPEMKLLFKGACSRMLMSVVDPMVVAVISETCACLMIGVACMFTPSNRNNVERSSTRHCLIKDCPWLP